MGARDQGATRVRLLSNRTSQWRLPAHRRSCEAMRRADRPRPRRSTSPSNETSPESSTSTRRSCRDRSARSSRSSRTSTSLVGGFPCQDYSVAKTLRQAHGIVGKKGVLWWEIHRLLRLKLEPADQFAISSSRTSTGCSSRRRVSAVATSRSCWRRSPTSGTRSNGGSSTPPTTGSRRSGVGSSSSGASGGRAASPMIRCSRRRVCLLGRSRSEPRRAVRLDADLHSTATSRSSATRSTSGPQGDAVRERRRHAHHAERSGADRLDGDVDRRLSRRRARRSPTSSSPTTDVPAQFFVDGRRARAVEVPQGREEPDADQPGDRASSTPTTRARSPSRTASTGRRGRS